MQLLFVIAMINLMMINGLISYLKIYKRCLNDNNYLGTEYDYELKLQENKKNQLINTDIKNMSIAIRKYNILKRLLFNIKNEQDIILKELIELGVDISLLNEDDN
jgi:hypothetical protein